MSTFMEKKTMNHQTIDQSNPFWSLDTQSIEDISQPNYTTGTQPPPIQNTPTVLLQEQPQTTGLIRPSEWQAHICYLIVEDGNPFTKVGVTKSRHSLERRLSNLQQGNPNKLRIHHTWYFEEEGEAYKLEQSILTGLQDYRTYEDSEWLELWAYKVIAFKSTGELP